jgi:LmbE family N-acetylglucosaminyl deacetylase
MPVTDVGELGTILGVWAHPDDETYCSAGIMAAAVRLGHRVVCVTATRGEAGSLDPVKWPPAQLGAVREAELVNSLAILGVTEHHWLDYHDGKVSEVGFEEGVDQVQHFVDDIEPHTILTFGPDGMTGHPDHKTISDWTTEAFQRAAPDGASLYYAVHTPEWARRWVGRMNAVHVFMEPDTPPVAPKSDLGIDPEMPPDLLDLKIQAIEAHESQVQGLFRLFGTAGMRQAMMEEAFSLGATK